MSSDPFRDPYNANARGHGCFGNIKAIMRRTGVVLSHDQITSIWEYVWHCANADEFCCHMDDITDEELKRVALDAKFRTKKPKLSALEAMMYA